MVKKKIKKAKALQWEELGNQMERDSMGNSKLLYRTLKNLKKNKKGKITGIENKEGQMLHQEKEII